jgi:hypothetical protein
MDPEAAALSRGCARCVDLRDCAEHSIGRRRVARVVGIDFVGEK